MLKGLTIKSTLSRIWRWTPIGFVQQYRQLATRVHNRRWAAIEDATDYLWGAKVLGEYCEFGVFEGDTFAYAHQKLGARFPNMRFFAFDSFQGLPPPRGVDNLGDFSSGFHAGQYACTLDKFKRNLRRRGVAMSQVRIVEGWFNDTLNEAMAARENLTSIAIAWIDGDLYESAVPILKFITNRISVGTLIIFDDWKVFRNLPDLGEQRACAEWLEANPSIKLRELFAFGHHGIAFTVECC